MTQGACPACGGSGWIDVRTRGMCGLESDFDEVEPIPCDVCTATAAGEATGQRAS